MTENPPRYTARDGMGDEETRRRWHMLRLEAMPGLTATERQAMRAERSGTTPEELAARLARQIADLADDAEDAGLAPVTGGLGDPAAVDTMIRVALPPDHRPARLFCAMCMRTLDKLKGRVEVRPGTFACDCCAGLEQDVPRADLDAWLADDPRYKRYAIAATYGVDAPSLTPAESHAEVTRMHENAEGMPLGIETTRAMAAAQLVPVRTFWALARERGREADTAPD